jgi:hypothetical protein
LLYGKSSIIGSKGEDALRITTSNYTLSHQRSRSVIFLANFRHFFFLNLKKEYSFTPSLFLKKLPKKNFEKELPQLQLPTT